LLYRAVGLATLRKGGDPTDEADAFAACDFSDAMLGDPELKSEAAGASASRVSVHPSVRAALIQRQRAFADQPGGAVLDGRDIGTVIAPHAQVKLFVTARPEVRAQRRHEELERMGLHSRIEAVLHDIQARDERDSSRRTAPLRQAEDAILLDTSNLAIEAAIQRAISLAEARITL